MLTEVVLEEQTNYGPPDYDGLWKRIIGELFEEFMLFFAPTLYKDIDFTIEPDFKQQELYKRIIKGRRGKNIADQIVKVSLKNGEAKWILIHIEVQAENGIDFSKRMFRYFFRIYDNIGEEVYAIALLTEDVESTHPDHFHYALYDTKLTYTYNTYKFIDHSIEELEKSSNPFAWAIIAGKYANKSKNDKERRFHFKTKLMKQVLERFPNQQEEFHTYLTALFYFIDYLLQTPEDMEERLKDELAEHMRKEGEEQMHAEKKELSPTLAGVIERLKKDALESGKKEGMEEGIEKEKKNIAMKLIREGLSDEKIVNITGLEPKEVETLKESPHE